MDKLNLQPSEGQAYMVWQIPLNHIVCEAQSPNPKSHCYYLAVFKAQSLAKRLL